MGSGCRGAIRAHAQRDQRASRARCLEAVAYQTYDLMNAMSGDGARPSELRADGGMAANSWLCQFLADILDMPVERPQNLETTALGAAFLQAFATERWPT